MLADRDYIKSSSKGHWPLIKVLVGVCLLINIAVFLSDGRLWEVFALSVDGLKDFSVWQVFTSLFLASSPQLFSFIFDVLILYYAAMRLEEMSGEQKLKTLYKKIFISLALMMPVLLVLFPFQYFSFLSALMLGTVCTYAWSFYAVKTRFYIFFILPLDLSGKNILYLIGVYALLVAWTNQWALLIIYAVMATVAYQHCKRGVKRQKKIKKSPKQDKKRVKRNEIQKGFKRIVKKDLADPEIDAILDKILEGGMESLSPQEKLLLESRSSLSEND
ncbi:hypothetical protein PQO03_14550 [Lentisphaera profundi]|uniref:DUF6576 domain-containing protein n=1 Tax=Lentisphaera profundi TaxID=1658616 RepID=A0ABY7W262_9BACT|nr:DUF6576 domain-containing protein [Lentisphaera profundi]WDE99054.1 hypothetical protein PQO03_14550 [Lentisphaera profundi]